MAQEVGIRELKNQASEIVRLVREEQAEYIVTYHGEPVARLLPIMPKPNKGGRLLPAKKAVPVQEQIETQPIAYQSKSISTLRPQNRAALALLREWRTGVTESDEELMRQFDVELEKNRLRFNSLHDNDASVDNIDLAQNS